MQPLMHAQQSKQAQQAQRTLDCMRCTRSAPPPIHNAASTAGAAGAAAAHLGLHALHALRPPLLVLLKNTAELGKQCRQLWGGRKENIMEDARGEGKGLTSREGARNATAPPGCTSAQRQPTCSTASILGPSTMSMISSAAGKIKQVGGWQRGLAALVAIQAGQAMLREAWVRSDDRPKQGG